MDWNFDNERPIYKQLVEQLKVFLITKAFVPGEKLPSVRDLAFETKVNPNTMQRALAEIESLGLVNTQRTSGRFVTEDHGLLERIQDEMARETTNQFLDQMEKLDIPEEKIIQYLQNEKKERTK